MPRGKKLAGGDGDLEWELLPDDVFVPRRGRGRVDLAGAMARRLGSRKRHRHAGDVFVPRRAPRGGPPADPGILVVRSRVHEPRLSLPSEPRELLVEPPPATWDGVWDATSAAAAVRDHDTGVEGDPTEVFAAHLASGWTLRPRRGVAGTHRSARGGAELASEGTLDSNAFVPTSRCLDLCAPRDDAAADDGSVDDADVFAEKNSANEKKIARATTATDRARGVRSEADGAARSERRGGDASDRASDREAVRRRERRTSGRRHVPRPAVVPSRAGRGFGGARARRRVSKSVSKKSPPTSRAAPQPPPATWRPAWRGPCATPRARSTRMRRWDARDRPIARFDRFGIATRRSVRARPRRR